MQYAEDLEEILECPVCLEIPNGEVTMCINGHHLCGHCKNLLISFGNKCPTCEGSFSNCRNYAVEKLSEKFKDIKVSFPRFFYISIINLEGSRLTSIDMTNLFSRIQSWIQDMLLIEELLKTKYLCTYKQKKNVHQYQTR